MFRDKTWTPCQKKELRTILEKKMKRFFRIPSYKRNSSVAPMLHLLYLPLLTSQRQPWYDQYFNPASLITSNTRNNLPAAQFNLSTSPTPPLTLGAQKNKYTSTSGITQRHGKAYS